LKGVLSLFPIEDEAILDKKLDSRNFTKKQLSVGIIEKLDEQKKDERTSLSVSVQI